MVVRNAEDSKHRDPQRMGASSTSPTEPKLQVVHLITDLERGGAETFLCRLVTWPQHSRVSHSIISLRAGGPLFHEARRAGVAVDTLNLGGICAAPQAVLRLVRTLRQRKADVLMTWLYHSDLVGTLAVALVPRVKLIWNIRCAEMNLSKYSRITRALPRVLARLSRRPAVVLANSQAGRVVHANYGYRPRRWQILGNGFDTGVFRPDRERRKVVRSMLGINDATPLVGLFARFDPMKDHATFLSAAATLLNRNSSPIFLLVGRGTNMPPLNALVRKHAALRERIVALGERDDVPALMPACDLIVCSSLSEAFPNVIGEAMASGVPCVSTDVGEARLLIGDTGRLVPKADPVALAQAIGELLNLAPDSRAHLGAAARQRIEKIFAFDAVVARYDRLLADVAAGGHRAMATRPAVGQTAADDGVRTPAD